MTNAITTHPIPATTNSGVGVSGSVLANNPFANGAAAAMTNPVGAAGTGQTVGNTNTPKGVQFWDPSKYSVVVNNRVVPGMTIPTTVTPGGPSFGNESGQNIFTGYNNANGGQFTNTTGSTNGIPYAQTSGGGAQTLGGAMNSLLDFGANADPTGIQAIQDQLVQGGYLDPTKSGFNYGSISGTKDPTYSAYYQLLETSIRTGTDYNAILQDRISRDAGKKYEDALVAQKAKLAKQQAAADAALLPQTVNRTATNISDPLTAQALLTQMLAQHLGRNPDTSELQQFTGALQTAQAQNPTLTTAITAPGQVQDKSSVQTGGFDNAQFTQNYVNQNFGQEQTAVGDATGFYSAALNILGAGGRGA